MELMIGQILLQAFILCGLLYLIARHEADFDFAKVAMVVAGITFGNFFIELSLLPRIGLFTILVEIAFVVFMTTKFCWLRWWKAVIVSVLFVAAQVGMAFGVNLLVSKVDQTVDEAGGTLLEQQQQDTVEAAKMIQEMWGAAEKE
jgi:hypothetical protein